MQHLAHGINVFKTRLESQSHRKLDAGRAEISDLDHLVQRQALAIEQALQLDSERVFWNHRAGRHRSFLIRQLTDRAKSLRGGNQRNQTYSTELDLIATKITTVAIVEP